MKKGMKKGVIGEYQKSTSVPESYQDCLDTLTFFNSIPYIICSIHI